MLKLRMFTFLLALFFITSLLGSAERTSPSRPYKANAIWQKNWLLESQLKMEIDADGFKFPVSLQFVPNPGKGPKAPLYYVIEIRGVVKVVTNDRSIYVFAKDFFHLRPREELPSVQGEVGLSGICLDPKNGYIFTPFTYRDEKEILRSAIARFSSKEKVFSLEPSEVKIFKKIFSKDESVVSHMIGPCQVKDGHLYVDVGDGERPYEAKNLDSTLGKMLRFNLDGTAPKDNPFYKDDKLETPRDFIWSYGLRNGFGLKSIEGKLIVAENGPGVDRVHHITKGKNSLWDGSDLSISLNTIATFKPTLSPVQIDYLGEKALFSLPENYQKTLYMAVAGSTSGENKAGIVALPLDMKSIQATGTPRYIIKYKGDRFQNVVGLNIGPDGLYFIPLYPLENGRSAVVKVSFSDEFEWAPLVPDNDGFVLMNHYGCLGCHSYYSMGSKHAPDLTPKKLKARLNARLTTAEYVLQLNKVDKLKRI